MTLNLSCSPPLQARPPCPLQPLTHTTSTQPPYPPFPLQKPQYVMASEEALLLYRCAYQGLAFRRGQVNQRAVAAALEDMLGRWVPGGGGGWAVCVCVGGGWAPGGEGWVAAVQWWRGLWAVWRRGRGGRLGGWLRLAGQVDLSAC